MLTNIVVVWYNIDSKKIGKATPTSLHNAKENHNEKVYC